MRELLEVARWRREMHATRRHVHPTHAGFWPLTARLRVPPPKQSRGSFVAILLVHKRPANIDLQIRAALHAKEIGSVVVSCNNPEVDLDRWIGVKSPRLQIVREAERNQTRRYAVALDTDGAKFFLPDDDVLMTPQTIDEFCRALPSDGGNPVGLTGQRFLGSGLWEFEVSGTGSEVDVLNRGYVCTRAHAEGVFTRAADLGWTEAETFSFPADDVLVSFAGERTPTIIDLPHVNCVSHVDVGISTYRQDNFHGRRAEWVGELQRHLDRAPAVRAAGSGALRAASTIEERVQKVMQPVRERYYRGRRLQLIGALPKPLRRLAGLGDSKAVRARRIQVGATPVALEGFWRVDTRAFPNVTLHRPAHELGLPRRYAFEILALDPSIIDAYLGHLDQWRHCIVDGGRVIVAAGSPDLEQRVSSALEAAGFQVAAVVTGGSLELDPRVSPWPVEVDGEMKPLQPVPAIADRSAGSFVVARAI